MFRERPDILKILSEGNGTFWDLTPKGIKLKSEEEVAEALGVKITSEPIDVPLELCTVSPIVREYIFRLVAEAGRSKSRNEVVQEIKELHGQLQSGQLSNKAVKKRLNRLKSIQRETVKA